MTDAANKLPLDRPASEFLSTSAITLPMDYTIDQALAFLRANPTDASIIYFYVIDADRKLLGVLPARRLLLSPGHAAIRDLMTRTLITIRGTDTLFDAMELFAIHRLLALPVVDAAGRFLGILEYSLYTEEVFDLAENRQLNEVFQLIGVRYSQAQQGHPLTGFKLRMPWLLANIAGGIMCAVLGSLFEATLQRVIVLSVFIPLVLTLAESVSVQSMTLAIESAGLRTDPRHRRRGLLREAATALLLGLASGGLVAGISLFWREPVAVPLTLGLALTLIMLLASVLGRIIPSAIHRLKLNPRIASGPVTLAIVDVATITIYLSAASILIR